MLVPAEADFALLYCLLSVLFIPSIIHSFDGRIFFKFRRCKFCRLLFFALKTQFHVEESFLSDLNCGGDLAHLPIKL